MVYKRRRLTVSHLSFSLHCFLQRPIWDTQPKPSAIAKKISESPQKVKVIRNTNLEHTAKLICYHQKDFGEALESESNKKYLFGTQRRKHQLSRKKLENLQKRRVVIRLSWDAQPKPLGISKQSQKVKVILGHTDIAKRISDGLTSLWK